MKRNTKKNMKRVMILTAAGLMISSAPMMLAQIEAAQANSVKASAASALKNIDAKLVKEVQKELKKVTGKTYSFSQATKWTSGKDSGWDLRIKEAIYSDVRISNGELNYFSLDQKWADLKDTYQQQFKTVLQDLNVESGKVPTTVKLTKAYSNLYPNPGKLELFASVDNYFITLLDGKIKRIMTTIPSEQVNQDVLDAADGAVKGLEGVNKGKLIKADFVKENNRNVYELQFESSDPKNPIFINVVEGSTQVTKVEISSMQDTPSEYTKGYAKLKGYKADELLKKATPQAKSFLNIDLTGYKGNIDADHPGVIHFTKANSPTIEGIYNTKGQFYHMEIK
jgi:hypothetical protein